MNQNNKKTKNEQNCEHDFELVEGIYALTKVEEENQSLVFYPNTGIPVIIYVCKKCGEIKLFSAVAKGEING